MPAPSPDFPRPSLILVDSSYYITLIRLGRDPLDELSLRAADYDIAINGIIWAEVTRGRSDPHVRARFERAFSVTRWLDLTPRGWQRVARLAWDLDRRGEILPLPDLVIAATALEHQAAVLTLDRHFQKIPALVALNDLP